MLKKSFQFPPKSKLTLNRACKYDGRFVSVKEIINAINWFFGEFGDMPIKSDAGDCLFVATKIEAPSVMATPYYASMGLGFLWLLTMRLLLENDRWFLLKFRKPQYYLYCSFNNRSSLRSFIRGNNVLGGKPPPEH